MHSATVSIPSAHEQEWTAYRSASDNGNKCASVAAIGLELVFQEGSQIFLHIEFVAHRLRKGSSSGLTKSTHMDNLILALEDLHVIEKWPQWSDLAIVDAFLELLGRRSGAIKVLVQTGPPGVKGGNIRVNCRGSGHDVW